MAGIKITRTDLTASDLRHAACGEKNARTARRMLAVAQVLDGFDRGTAARNCGRDRQTLRDWVLRCNAGGLAGLSGLQHSGRPPVLTPGQREQFAALVEAGPKAAGRKIVRWRCKDLREELASRFGIAVHERTVGKFLNTLGCRRLSVRPQHPKSNVEAQEAFKKTLPGLPLPSSRKKPGANPSKSGSRTRPGSGSRAL